MWKKLIDRFRHHRLRPEPYQPRHLRVIGAPRDWEKEGWA
jgi:hypothetical protein